MTNSEAEAEPFLHMSNLDCSLFTVVEGSNARLQQGARVAHSVCNICCK